MVGWVQSNDVNKEHSKQCATAARSAQQKAQKQLSAGLEFS